MKSRKSSLISLFVCFAAFLLVNQSVFAGIFLLSPASKTVNAGDTFTVDVNVDPGSDKLFGVQAFVLYDKNVIEAQSVAAGSYFPTVTKNIVAGKVYISGDTQIGSPISGTGTLATITFKALTSGSSTLTFLCDINSNDTSVIGKNDANSTNVIECNRNGTMAVTVSGTGSGGGTNPTAVPTSAPSNDNNDDDDGDGSSNTNNNSNTNTNTNSTEVKTLPKTGAMDNLIFFAGAGLAFVCVGGVARLVLKFS